jgi:2-keto-3-deoxy-L-fuconate dehydrogenase
MSGTGQLAGKVAIVTGAASGIGLAISTAFTREGAFVLMIDRDGDLLAAAQRDTAAGGAAAGATDSLIADVTDGAAMVAAVADTLSRRGRLTTVVTSAGISFGKRLIDSDAAEWEQTFAVNVFAAMKLLKPAIPAMIASGGGAIVTLASQLAVAGGRNNCAYVASKGAVVAMTKSIAIDHATDGIRANAILPGATDTPLLRRSFARRGADAEAAMAASRSRHAMQRFGKPDEIASAAVYLASDAAAFITGVALPVDGGWLAA